MTEIESLLRGFFFLFGFLVTLTVILRVLAWLFTVSTHAYKRLSDILAAAIIRGLISLFHHSHHFLKLAANAISTSITLATSEWWAVLLEELKLWQLYWKYGRADFKRFRAFRRHMRGEEDEQNEANEDRKSEDNNHRDNTRRDDVGKSRKSSDYQIACSFLGLPKDGGFRQEEFKLCYRRLMSKHHPDKGGKSPEMAQKINDAAKTIKLWRKWR